MNNFVQIKLEFDDNEESVESIKGFFAPIENIQIIKTEQKTQKSLAKVIEIVLTIVGTWASERYILDPLAEKAGEWLNGIKDYWNKTGFQSKINVIIKFQKDNFEIQLIGSYEPEVLKQVWMIAKDVIELIEKQNIQADKIRITTNPNNSLLIIGYSGCHPKYKIDLDKQVILPIKSSSNTDEGDHNPEIETWLIDQLKSRLEYLKLIRQHGYAVTDSEISNLENEIFNRIQQLTL